MHVHNAVQLAYDAGYAVGNIDRHASESGKPSAKAVNDAIDNVEMAAVQLAHTHMEETAKRCGFEGLTEALGYLITLRDNPVAELVREAVNLCIVGDITESDDVAAEGGWGNWLKRARAVVGDAAPPPETITVEAHETALDRLEVEAAPFMAPRPVGMLPQLAAGFEHKGAHEGVWPQMSGRGQRPENQVLSGCAVRAAIQVDEAAVHAAEEAEHDAAMDSLYGKGGAKIDKP